MSASQLVEQQQDLHHAYGTLLYQYYYNNDTLFETAMGLVIRKIPLDCKYQFIGDGMFYKNFIYALEKNNYVYSINCQTGAVVKQFIADSPSKNVQRIGIMGSKLFYLSSQSSLNYYDLEMKEVGVPNDFYDLLKGCEWVNSLHSFCGQLMISTYRRQPNTKDRDQIAIYNGRTWNPDIFDAVTHNWQDNGQGCVLLTTKCIALFDGQRPAVGEKNVPKAHYDPILGRNRGYTFHRACQQQYKDYLQQYVNKECILMNLCSSVDVYVRSADQKAIIRQMLQTDVSLTVEFAKHVGITPKQLAQMASELIQDETNLIEHIDILLIADNGPTILAAHPDVLWQNIDKLSQILPKALRKVLSHKLDAKLMRQHVQMAKQQVEELDGEADDLILIMEGQLALLERIEALEKARQ